MPTVQKCPEKTARYMLDSQRGRVIKWPLEHHHQAINRGVDMPVHSVIDQRARDMAQAAISKIESHEEACELRDGHKLALLTTLQSGVDGLYSRFWIAAISTISMLATACASLLYMVAHAPH